MAGKRVQNWCGNRYTNKISAISVFCFMYNFTRYSYQFLISNQWISLRKWVYRVKYCHSWLCIIIIPFALSIYSAKMPMSFLFLSLKNWFHIFTDIIITIQHCKWLSIVDRIITRYILNRFDSEEHVDNIFWYNGHRWT